MYLSCHLTNKAKFYLMLTVVQTYNNCTSQTYPPLKFTPNSIWLDILFFKYYILHSYIATKTLTLDLVADIEGHTREQTWSLKHTYNDARKFSTMLIKQNRKTTFLNKLLPLKRPLSRHAHILIHDVKHKFNLLSHTA